MDDSKNPIRLAYGMDRRQTKKIGFYDKKVKFLSFMVVLHGFYVYFCNQIAKIKF